MCNEPDTMGRHGIPIIVAAARRNHRSSRDATAQHSAGAAVLPRRDFRGSQIMFLGEADLRRTLTAFAAHDHCERNHQGIQDR